ncbi:hypothetical protein BDY24DRAFT_344424, partial [Mrakia frigida]|uniref:uncharacterized protein n=1 Tax=Mrakia frigida TaxID=29902 RepID=UPI003FCBF33A
SNSTSSSTNSTLTPYIPTNLSSGCTTYLTSLNSDSTLAQCVTPLLTATTQAANANSSTALTQSLTSLCATTACDDTTIRTKLSQFYGACSVELNGAEGEYDETVREIYDLLYVVQPLRSVVCTKDETTKAFCVQSLSAALSANSTSTTTTGTSTNATAFAAHHLSIEGPSVASFSKRSSSSNQLVSRADSTDTTTYPNSTTYKTTNLPYLFLQPTSPLSALCSSCAKAVFTAYAEWEYRTPYALGLSASPILGGQAALWKGAQETCGATWVNAIQTSAVGSEEAAAAVGGSSSGTSAGELKREMGRKGLVMAVVVVGAGLVLVG